MQIALLLWPVNPNEWLKATNVSDWRLCGQKSPRHLWNLLPIQKGDQSSLRYSCLCGKGCASIHASEGPWYPQFSEDAWVVWLRPSGPRRDVFTGSWQHGCLLLWGQWKSSSHFQKQWHNPNPEQLLIGLTQYPILVAWWGKRCACYDLFQSSLSLWIRCSALSQKLRDTY